jgi:hypothetical protein
VQHALRIRSEKTLRFLPYCTPPERHIRGLQGATSPQAASRLIELPNPLIQHLRIVVKVGDQSFCLLDFACLIKSKIPCQTLSAFCSQYI